VTEKHGQAGRLGMHIRITGKGRYAHAPGKEQGRRIRPHLKTRTQRPPDNDLIATLQAGETISGRADHADKQYKATGSHAADGHGARPYRILTAQRAKHDKLARLPVLPLRLFQRKGIETTLAARASYRLAKGHVIRHREFGSYRAYHDASTGFLFILPFAIIQVKRQDK
jgi:hypothetical protein